MTHTLVIDVGSSSIRALIFDTDLTIVAKAGRTHRFITDPPGASIADPLHLLALTETCIDQVLAEFDGTIRAVAMTTFVGNFLGVDAQNNPTTPLSTYADTRAASELAELRARYFADPGSEAANLQRTGCPLHTAYHPARLRWFAGEKFTSPPNPLSEVSEGESRHPVRWIDLATFFYTCWFGRDVPCSYSVASWSGLLERSTLQWDARWLDRLGLAVRALPRLADIGAVERGLMPEYARRWTMLADVPFMLAVGDGAAANVGTGAVHGQIALTVGTTAALRIVSHEVLPVVPDGLWSYRVTAAHHLIGGATTEGGNIFEWAREVLRLPELTTDIEAQLSSKLPGEHGLTVLPLLGGERSPGYRAEATGTITGLRLNTTALDILQAGLESVALRLSIIADRLDPTGTAAVYASGGALAASRAWTQIMADGLNRPIYRAAESETSARGAAILARHVLDGTPLDAFAPTLAEVIQPRPEAVAALRRLRARQGALYGALYGVSGGDRS